MDEAVRSAVDVRITGVVQGVGFRPFVYRLAGTWEINGWVRNGNDGVQIHAEGTAELLERFVASLRDDAPAAAHITSLTVTPASPVGASTFTIEASRAERAATVRISPDVSVCEECLAEMFDRYDRRYWYPYINCTNCGPRYSIVTSLPYDRTSTTMRAWPMCVECRREYEDPENRRFHAQPTACPRCGPSYALLQQRRVRHGRTAIEDAVALLRAGGIVAVKGIGGYHLACDARDGEAVGRLRARKFRKERPFAVMARDLDAARSLVSLDPAQAAALSSRERPIVLASAITQLDGVAPDNGELGLMLPYTPLHHLLFAAGAPDVMVMTSANRSSEPIAYNDEEAIRVLTGIADAFLIGDRPIARRIDDSVVRISDGVPTILRRARGLAPDAVAQLPAKGPILALGADLKNAIALVVDGQVFGSQHIGDVEHLSVRSALRRTIEDLCGIYEVDRDALTIVHDMHPGYYTTELAAALPSAGRLAVQHHRAHVASVIAERGAWSTPVLAFAFDGMGYGEDGTIWGGEVFSGTLGHLRRTGHMRKASLPGGDAAAHVPVQAAAGFLAGFDPTTFLQSPFDFPSRFKDACKLATAQVQSFHTTSMGRLFDTVAALLGFVREQTFEGQAAMWLEHLAWRSARVEGYSFSLADDELDYRGVLEEIVDDRLAGRNVAEIAYAFHRAVASAVLCVAQGWRGPVVVSGGVFQNRLLCGMLYDALGERLWTNRAVPPNDGGIALGQAAIAGFLLGF